MNNDVWYKNPWVWLVIFFPVLAVVAGIATVIITSQNQPDMVVDDYYKKGKAINQELTLYNKALELGVELSLNVTQDRIEVKSNKTLPAIKLQMVHSTLAASDFTIVLTPNAIGSFSATVEQSLDGKWQAILMPMDESWKVKSTITLPDESWVTVK